MAKKITPDLCQEVWDAMSPFLENDPEVVTEAAKELCNLFEEHNVDVSDTDVYILAYEGVEAITAADDDTADELDFEYAEEFMATEMEEEDDEDE